MTPRQRAWLLILGVFAVCGLMLWGAVWYRSRTMTPAAMLKRLPTDDAVVLFIDFSQLRQRHILQLLDSATVGHDPEYQGFVQKTNFDYQQDLDTAIAAFAPTGKFMLLKGRFDWKALKAYVLSQDGKCLNAVCKMVGSAPDRRISFFPLQQNVMALAVSPEESAAERMSAVSRRPDTELPSAPLWMTIPPSVLKSGQNLPSGTQMFVHSMERAEGVTLWAVPEAQGFSARLSVRCATVEDAVDMASKLNKVTALLRELIEKERQTPNPADLSGLLTAGTFHNEGQKVLGTWPVSQALLDNLLGGK
ncbi:MAG TPA: hypothetical protein VMS37_08685 [Verrucomicrobiae bacterium]|nr:hypothetical protein [Verrucomicrobiae bacterium]